MDFGVELSRFGVIVALFGQDLVFIASCYERAL